MTANGYFGSLVMTPQNSGAKFRAIFSLMVRLPTGVSKLSPSSALRQLSLSTLPAFLMPSAKA